MMVRHGGDRGRVSCSARSSFGQLRTKGLPIRAWQDDIECYFEKGIARIWSYDLSLIFMDMLHGISQVVILGILRASN